MNTAILNDESVDSGEITDASECSGVHPVQRLKYGDVIAHKYVVRGTLGSGGFAVVYDAEHLGLGRMVAIKVLHLDVETPLALVERFRQEARISAVLQHPNILQVYDTGTLDDGSPYLVMERIDGETLYKKMSRRGLTIPALVEVTHQLLTALSVIEEHGIVHRDIKPENVMLHAAGDGTLVVKVLDFGISKDVSGTDLRLTRNGALIGTPHYMSPEQIRGERLDIRSDLYGLGVVMYEALTGRVPYDGASLNALVLAALNADLPPVRELRPDCPRELERIVCKALARERDQRYASPAAMQRDIERLAQSTRMPRGANAWRTLQWVPPAEAARAPIAIETDDTLVAPAPARPWRKPARWRQHLPVASLLALLFAGALESRRPERAAETAPRAAASAAENRPGSANAPGAAGGGSASAVQAAMVLEPQAEVTQLVRAAFEPLVESVDPAPAPRASRDGERRRARAKEPAQEHPRGPQRVAVQPLEPVRQQPVVSAPPPTPAKRAAAPADAGLIREALAAYVLGDLERAHRLYRNAVEQLPNSPEAFRGLGIVAARRGLQAEARRAFARYLELSPHAPDAEAIRSRSHAMR